MDLYVNRKTRVKVRVPGVVGERLGPDWYQPATPKATHKAARKPTSTRKK